MKRLVRSGEAWRLAIVVLTGLWLTRGFITPSLCGSGDAQWYDNMMADVQQQVRHGVFPLFVGQSEYQFNGAIYPLRVAPAFHYLGALLDYATFHQLEPVALTNLLLVLIGVAAAVLGYLCLRSLVPKRRWLACLLALLYVACPGVLGAVYNMNMFMTWTTVPMIPVAIYGVVRSFRAMDFGAIACMGGGAGLLWWGHTPVAAWTTGFVVFFQLVRLCSHRPRWAEWSKTAAAATLFLAVASYPLVSVLIATPESGQSVSNFQDRDLGAITFFVGSVFPAILLPLSKLGATLSDFQLGYSLWLLWLVGLGAAVWKRSGVLASLALWSTGLILLLTPIPRFNLWLWQNVPAVICNMTGNSPMPRIYPSLACIIVFMGALGLDAWLDRGPRRRLVAYPLIGLLCLWSGLEAERFAAGARASRRPDISGHQAMMLENVGPTRFAYFNFPSEVPPYFTNGITDFYLESRLLDRDTRQLLAGDIETLEQGIGTTLLAQGEFRADPREIPIYHYQPRLTVEPGRRYGVIFNFKYPEATGVLIVQGGDLFRLYALPEFGGAKSFGAAPGHSRLLPLWTDGPQPEEIRFEFRNTGTWTPRDLSTLASFHFVSYDPVNLPVRVNSFIPYRATVHAPAASWLETPRMYQEPYQALVNGHRVPVAKSPAGLVMVPVPQGVSEVKVQYYPPPYLLVSFWLSFIAAAITVLAITRYLFNPLPSKAL